jgi:hypothetical protein
MPLYHLLLDADAFHRRIRPALAEAWQRCSFEPCRALCAELVPAALAFRERYHLGPEELLLNRAALGLPFDRNFWRYLACEILWFSAGEIPQLETTPDALCCLIGVDRTLEEGLAHDRLAPIQQAYFGARDLAFGMAFYRPADAGYNDQGDVRGLAAYLGSLDPSRWTADALASLPELASAEDRAEELELVKEWLPPFQDLYRRAAQADQVILCERVEAGRPIVQIQGPPTTRGPASTPLAK